jgi:SET and MYND domain-containing protein
MVLRCGRRKYTNQELDLFSQLRTHIKEIRDQSPAQWERISLSSKAVKAYSGTDMKEETISAFSAKVRYYPRYLPLLTP